MYYDIFIIKHISPPPPQYKKYILNVLLFLVLTYKIGLYIKYNNINGILYNIFVDVNYGDLNSLKLGFFLV